MSRRFLIILLLLIPGFLSGPVAHAGITESILSYIVRCLARSAPPPYQVIRKKKTEGLGTQYLIERRADLPDWKALNFIGSPTIPMGSLGPEFSRFLGFEILDDRRVLVPSAGYLNARIKQYNASVTDPDLKILAVFYEPKIARVPEEEFAERAILKREFPVAGEGGEQLHDLAFHIVGALGLPEKAYVQAQARYEMARDLHAFMTTRYPDLLAKPMYVSRSSSRTVGATIDYFLANRKDAHEYSSARLGFAMHPDFPKEFANRNNDYLQDVYGDLGTPLEGIDAHKVPDKGWELNSEYEVALKEFLSQYQIPSGVAHDRSLGLSLEDFRALVKRRQAAFEAFAKGH